MFQHKTYSELRKEREEFRKKLIWLIIKKDDKAFPSDAIPSAEEMELLRYYYYIHNGVDTVHVAPIDKEWMQHVLALIPSKLRKWEELLEELTDEMKEDFLMSVKKGIVDFVLQDPGLSDLGIAEYDSETRREMKQICRIFSPNYEPTKMKTLQNLHTINNCIAQVLDLWYRQFM